MYRLTVLNATVVFLSLLFCSCGSLHISQVEVDKEFYISYPKLRNRINNLSSHVESNSFREVMRYYRFEVEPSTADIFLSEQGFIEIDQLRPGKDVRTDKLATIHLIQCNERFISLLGNKNLYQSWWDVNLLDKPYCYLVPPDHPHRQKRAIYDVKRKVLYLHVYYAG
jgi:hypothetical protein